MFAVRKGFTLVEVIVVLVVIAILAAILIPALTGWIDKAADGQSIMEARHCLVAAESIAVKRYAVGSAYALSADKADTMKLAGSLYGGDLQTMNFDATANPVYMVYRASNGRVVTYQNGVYSISDGSGGVDFSDPGLLSQFYGIMQGVMTKPATGQYYYSGTDAVLALTQALRAGGIDLDSAASSWSIRYSPANGYPKLYWTNASMSGHRAGDVIPVMAFTPTTQHYTVWNVRLVDTGGGKLGLGPEVGGIVSTTTGDDQTYAQMLIDYAAATGS